MAPRSSTTLMELHLLTEPAPAFAIFCNARCSTGTPAMADTASFDGNRDSTRFVACQELQIFSHSFDNHVHVRDHAAGRPVRREDQGED